MSGLIGRRVVSQGLGNLRCYTKQTSKSATGQAPNPNVPGLSEKCVAVPNMAVGPGAAKDKAYKNPEYYCYHIDSFAEAEVEMKKFRLPAPSNKRKFVP